MARASPKRPQVSTLGGWCRPGPPRPVGNFGVTQAAEWSKRVVAGSWPLGGDTSSPEQVFVIHLASATFGMADPAAAAQAIDGEWHERLAVENIGESRSCSTLDKL